MRNNIFTRFKRTPALFFMPNYGLGKIQCAEMILAHTNAHRFSEAEFHFSKWLELNKKFHYQYDKPLMPKKIKPVGSSETNNQIDSTKFFEFTSLESIAIRHTLKQMNNLLDDPKKCFELLRKLDKDIERLSSPRVDFSKIIASPLFIMNGIQVPESIPSSIDGKETDDLLLHLIHEKLEAHGFKNDGEVVTFSGFVDIKSANEIIRNGRLFKEDCLAGNALIHGIYSHYLQWYIFAAAIEEGIITLPENFTLADILKTIIDHQLWGAIIDSVSPSELNEHYLSFNMGPHRLNSALLFCDETPHLRGYMLSLWYDGVSQFQTHFKETYETEIPYRCIVGAQAVALEKFLAFDPFCLGNKPGEIISRHL